MLFHAQFPRSEADSFIVQVSKNYRDQWVAGEARGHCELHFIHAFSVTEAAQGFWQPALRVHKPWFLNGLH
jgi:hypothetical protein